MSKRMVISATFSTKTGGCEQKKLEIHPYCIESMEQESSMWKCRTLSGEIFFVTQKVHDVIIKKEGGLE